MGKRRGFGTTGNVVVDAVDDGHIFPHMAREDNWLDRRNVICVGTEVVPHCLEHSWSSGCLILFACCG